MAMSPYNCSVLDSKNSETPEQYLSSAQRLYNAAEVLTGAETEGDRYTPLTFGDAGLAAGRAILRVVLCEHDAANVGQIWSAIDGRRVVGLESPAIEEYPESELDRYIDEREEAFAAMGLYLSMPDKPNAVYTNPNIIISPFTRAFLRSGWHKADTIVPLDAGPRESSLFLPFAVDFASKTAALMKAPYRGESWNRIRHKTLQSLQAESALELQREGLMADQGLVLIDRLLLAADQEGALVIGLGHHAVSRFLHRAKPGAIDIVVAKRTSRSPQPAQTGGWESTIAHSLALDALKANGKVNDETLDFLTSLAIYKSLFGDDSYWLLGPSRVSAIIPTVKNALTGEVDSHTKKGSRQSNARLGSVRSTLGSCLKKAVS